MDRRKALKNIGLGMGALVATPTVLSVLNSCKDSAVSWTAQFLTPGEQNVVTHLADIILPSSDIPGALDVDVPQFLDKMYFDLESENNREKFKKGSKVFNDRLGSHPETVSKKTVEKVFRTYYELDENGINEVKKLRNKNVKDVSDSQLDDYFMYHYLHQVRSYTLFGYFSSKTVGTEVLNYDPVPGRFDPCVPLEDIGNSWSL